MNNSVLIGRIARPHGIKGEVRVDYYADSLLLLKAALLLKTSDKSFTLHIQSHKKANNQIIIKFKEITDRNMAEALGKAEIFISKEDRNKFLKEKLPNKVKDHTLVEKITALEPSHQVQEAYSQELSIQEQEKAQVQTPLCPENTKDTDIFLDDLVGLIVFLDNEPVPFGTLSQIDIIADREIWTILTNDKEILFPAVPEFVPEINLEKGYVRICPPPGLFELY